MTIFERNAARIAAMPLDVQLEKRFFILNLWCEVKQRHQKPQTWQPVKRKGNRGYIGERDSREFWRD